MLSATKWAAGLKGDRAEYALAMLDWWLDGGREPSPATWGVAPSFKATVLAKLKTIPMPYETAVSLGLAS